MKIKKITINSFRGIKNVEFELNEKLNVFTGANGIGKSTIIDSVMWVLANETLVYGLQDSDNRNFKDLKEPIHVLLELDNGVVLERKYADIWKENNDGDLVYSRTENQLRINGAKYTVKEYEEYIRDNIIKLDRNIKLPKGYNIVRSLMDYNYFGIIDYKIARKFIEQVLNLKSDDDILNEEQFRDIKTDMQIFKYEIPKCMSKYRDEISKLDSSIENTQETLRENEKQYTQENLDKYNELFEERTKLLNSNYYHTQEYFELQSKIDNNNKEINEIEISINEEINELQNQVQDLNTKANYLLYDISKYQSEISKLERNINNANVEIEESQRLLEQTKEQKFNENNCPKCGYVLNESELRKQQEQKQERITFLNSNIDKYTQILSALNDDLEKAKNELELKKQEHSSKQEEFNSLQAKIREIQNTKANNNKIQTLTEANNEIRNQILEQLQASENERMKNIDELSNKLSELSNVKYLGQTIEKLKSDLKQQKQLKALAENKLLLVKEFKELKLNMIKDNSNKVFPNLDLEIIEVNENTGVMKEVCYVQLKNVEYKGINDGHKKLVGIMVIECIKKALNLSDLPIVFDKKADVDNDILQSIFNVTNCQILTTQVSDDREIKLLGK